MLIALTFLGTGDYKETTYIKHDDESQTKTTNLFPIAVAELYKPDKIIAFTTERVTKTKQDDLKKLKDKYAGRFTTQNIPNGNSPAELWEIFNNCINVFKDDEDNSEVEIVLDITHAFRSIPLLIFIVAAYLRQVKNIKLKHIIYGAFEARNSEANETRIFDLTPFVELLDWMNAVNVFQNYGDARPIASLNVDPDMKKVLNSLSDALLTNRTLEAQKAAMTFNLEAQKAAMTFNGVPFDDTQQPPFQMLIDQLKQSYQNMAVNNPVDKPKNSLKAQYQQIEWYMDNQHYLQAITLMREWLISWKCLKDNKEWLNAGERSNVEDEFNNIDENNPFAILDAEMQAPTRLWNGCKIRNDLAHCGMRNNPKKAKQAISEIKELFTEFKTFADNK